MRVLDHEAEVDYTVSVQDFPDSSIVVSPWDLPGGPMDNTIIKGKSYELQIPVTISFDQFEQMYPIEIYPYYVFIHPWYCSVSFALDDGPFSEIYHNEFTVMWPCNATFNQCWFTFIIPLKLDTLGEHTLYYEFEFFGLYDYYIYLGSSQRLAGELTRTTWKTVVVVGEGPTCNFSFSPQSGEIPLTVNFTDKSTSDIGIVSWQWFFGDGGESQEKNPTYVYSQPGSFLVILSIMDDYGVSECEASIVVLPSNGNGNGNGDNDSNWKLWVAIGGGITLIGTGLVLIGKK